MSEQASQRRARPRLRLACLRCQRRKIRCTGELPACRSCRNAGVPCTDGESSRLRGQPRAHITTLEDRIKWLESVIRTKCPEVNLEQTEPLDSTLSGAEDTGVDDSTLTGRDDTELSALPIMEVEVSTVPGTVEGSALPSTHVEGQDGTGSHEIGLVSLGANQDPRYIGPSSGYFLARVMLSSPVHADAESLPTELVEAVQGPAALPTRAVCEQLCDAYFDFIHPQYPVLHRPAFTLMLDKAKTDQDPVASFQVFMVLAIGATVLSRRTAARIPGEPFCLAAMRHFDRLNIENSIQGLQCLVLLLVFSIHSPSVRLNVWYLNYQCIASLIDLGLQRDITVRSGITPLEQELRTRIFWVVFMLDRTIATMMGRPVGFRDEACQLRLPRESSSDLMDYSVHLFKLAKINSEIKYVANSVVREAPRYAYPTVVDIFEWQRGVLQQLDQWEAEIPKGSGIAAVHMEIVCRLRYHGVRMLLLRPSPAIPKPSADALALCYGDARAGLATLNELYRKNLLIHSWLTFHALVQAILTMLYCVKASDVARGKADELAADLSAGLGLLSATGEHWSGAKRCRDLLDDLGRDIVQWLRAQDSVVTSAGFEHSFDDPFGTFGADIDSESLDAIVRDLFQGLIPDNPAF